MSAFGFCKSRQLWKKLSSSVSTGFFFSSCTIRPFENSQRRANFTSRLKKPSFEVISVSLVMRGMGPTAPPPEATIVAPATK